VQSLGGTVSITERITHYTYKNEIKNGQLSYRIILTLPNHINPFKLPRKSILVKPRLKYHPRRYIVNVEYIGRKHVRSILLQNSDQLYITNDCIVTCSKYFLNLIL